MCFRPDTQALRLENVNLYVMRHVGVRVLLLDADNTITRWNSPEISPQVKEWVRTAKEAGFAVLVVSNNHAPRLEPISRQLEINCIPQVRKPLPFRLKKLAKQLVTAANWVKMQSDEGEINPVDILRWPGVMAAQEQDLDAIAAEILAALDGTLDDFIIARETEGQALKVLIEQMREQIQNIE